MSIWYLCVTLPVANRRPRHLNVAVGQRDFSKKWRTVSTEVVRVRYVWVKEPRVSEQPHLLVVCAPTDTVVKATPTSELVASDDLLMLGAAQGHHPAFAQLVQRYEAQVRRFAQSLLGDGPQARDAAQEVFLRLWQARGQYRAQGRFREYLFTLARNLCRSKRRRKRLADFLGLNDGETQQPLDSLPTAAGDAAWTQQSKERERLLRVALQSLEESFRTPVVLRYLNELSYEEIAVVIGRTPSTARSRVFYGLKRLAELLPHEVA